jgi:16S rRNA (guanine966-N2)-methyltransferase
LFDMLMHAEWGGRDIIEGAVVLDVFAGTGALGLEALSRGAASACFIESDGAALKALRANIAACRAEDRTVVVAGDVLRVAPSAMSHSRREHGHKQPAKADAPRPAEVDGKGGGAAASLIFLDPPYGRDLVPRTIARLCEAGRMAPNALIIAETGRDEKWVPEQPLLAERQHGAARMLIFRAATLNPQATSVI